MLVKKSMNSELFGSIAPHTHQSRTAYGRMTDLDNKHSMERKCIKSKLQRDPCSLSRDSLVRTQPHCMCESMTNSTNCTLQGTHIPSIYKPLQAPIHVFLVCSLFPAVSVAMLSALKMVGKKMVPKKAGAGTVSGKSIDDYDTNELIGKIFMFFEAQVFILVCATCSETFCQFTVSNCRCFQYSIPAIATAC